MSAKGIHHGDTKTPRFELRELRFKNYSAGLCRKLNQIKSSQRPVSIGPIYSGRVWYSCWVILENSAPLCLRGKKGKS